MPEPLLAKNAPSEAVLTICPPSAMPDHPRHERLHQVDVAAQVDAEDPVIIVVCRVLERAEDRDAGGAEQHRHRAEHLLGLIGSVGERLAVGDVEFDAVAFDAFAAKLTKCIRDGLLHGYRRCTTLHPARAEHLGLAEPGAARAAGDEGGAPGKIECHRILSLVVAPSAADPDTKAASLWNCDPGGFRRISTGQPSQTVPTP